MIALFVTAFVLGLVFNAAPGAVFAETVRHAVRGGYRPALQVQIGSLVGDALWAILGLVGIGLLLRLDVLRAPIGIAGVLYLLWLARDSWRAASQEFTVDQSSAAASANALRAGMLLSVTNPQNVAYWAALGSAMGAVGVHQPTAIHYGVFFAGFMVSSVLWSFVCAGALALLFRKANTAWAKITYRICALAFIGLALMSLRNFLDDRQASHSKTSPTAVAPS